MKKIIIGIICVLLVLIAVFSYWNITTYNKINEVKKFNNEFLKFTDKKILNGVEITTVMNKAIDINEQNGVKKDENGAYILNDENSIEILVQPNVNGEYFLMEAFQKSGMKSFTDLYGNFGFITKKIEKHQNGKISKIIFESAK